MNGIGQVKVIKGEGTFPIPEVRKIYPTRALLWKYYLLESIIWIGVLIGGFLLRILFVIGDDPPPIEILDNLTMLFFIGSIVVSLFIAILLPFYVRSMEFIVHGDEVIVKKGLINKTVKYCPYRTVTNISTTVGPFDRLFGIGCVNIQTAGKSGTSTGPEEKFEGLPLYDEIRDYILKQLRAFYTTAPRSVEISPKETNSMDVQREMIKELREIKQLLKQLRIGDIENGN